MGINNRRRCDNSMKHRKGEVVEELRVQTLIPLYTDDIEWQGLVLPQYTSDDHWRRGVPDRRHDHDDALSAFVRKLLSKPQSMERDVIISCVHLVAKGEHDEWAVELGGKRDRELRPDDDDQRRLEADISDDDTDDDLSLELRSSWNVVKTILSFGRWKKLVREVASRVVFVESPHPLYRYATHQLPNLPETDRRLAIATLLNLLNGGAEGVSNSSSVQSTAILSVMKLCQDRFNTPRRYGVLPRRQYDLESTFPHSCIPTAWLDLGTNDSKNHPLAVRVSALFDVRDGEQVSVCYVDDDDDVEVREGDVRLRTGSSCGCLRCRYESNRRIPLSSQQQQTLARLYLSKGQLATARQLYEASLDDTPDQPDVWHALGSIQLSQGRFMEAQRTWKEGSDRFPLSCRMHKGVTLQMEKAQKYKYFDPPPLDDACTEIYCPPYTTRAPVPNVQVAQMLSQSTCQQILEWATSQGQWTQQRHYAVPTNDVPVHTIEPLLAWFNRWFFFEMRPHLAQQFGSSPNYFVHDAFCVQYVAGKMSNHLPIHTDESTHSFVVALNDCDDYEGGGTYFPQTDAVVRLKVGEVLSFRGDSFRHGGEAVTKNARHILVAFLYHDDDGREATLKNRKRSQDLSELAQRLNRAKEQKTQFSFGFAL